MIWNQVVILFKYPKAVFTQAGSLYPLENINTQYYASKRISPKSQEPVILQQSFIVQKTRCYLPRAARLLINDVMRKWWLFVTWPSVFSVPTTELNASSIVYPVFLIILAQLHITIISKWGKAFFPMNEVPLKSDKTYYLMY